MIMNEFKDCEYRYSVDDVLFCKNKEDKCVCDNCKGNIHLNCDNYNPVKDLCLKWFETDVSEHLNECAEKTVFNDNDLQKKWSN